MTLLALIWRYCQLNSIIHHLYLLLISALFSAVLPCAKLDASELRSRVHDRRAIIETNDNRTVLAVRKSIRSIQMFYKIDMRKHNSLSPQIARAMQENDSNIRNCYINRLDSGKKIRGKMALGIRISKSTGRIGRVVRLGGELQDNQLFQCLKKELVRMPLNSYNKIQGTVVFDFDSATRSVP